MLGGRIVEGWVAHCRAVSAARSRVAIMTDLARSGLALLDVSELTTTYAGWHSISCASPARDQPADEFPFANSWQRASRAPMANVRPQRA
jgi:hypothetical protein